MTYEDILNQAVAMLQRQKCLTYESLQLQFHLDAAHLEVLKNQLLYAHPHTVSDDGLGLVWTGDSPEPAQNVYPEPDKETRFQALLPAVMIQLQAKRRVTYRTLKYIFGLSESLLNDIREELLFVGIVRDENGQGLVWMGEPHPAPLNSAVALSPPSTVETTVLPSPAVAASTPLAIAMDNPPNGSASFPEDSSTDVRSTEPIVMPEPTPETSEAERRQLTVMFCDLVGSTDLSGRLDPEHLREVVKAYQEAAAEVIERYEGHIAQYLGDGLLIYFGYPAAHEDDAQRAVYAGLGVVEAMGKLNVSLEANYSVQLAVRIGVHTGLVVIGEMGGGGRHENLALGKTPNIAARLEGLAQPNAVVISPVTARLVQREFVLEDLGPHEFKGVSEPMVVARVVRAVELQMQQDFSMLVGRDEEVGLLLRRWGQSKEGLGQVILLSGEAGIGKSSLVDRLRSHVRQERLTRIVMRCSPYHTNSTLYPIIESIQRTLEWHPDDTAEIRLAKLEQALEVTHLELKAAIPLMASLLSLELPEERYPVLRLSPQQQRQQTQDTIVAWLQAEAERQPMLGVWEDLHWADPSTLEVLGRILEQAPTLPMLHMLTFRPEFEPPWPARSHMTPITLNRLERPQVEALIMSLARGKGLPTKVVQHIVAKTDGVPLYVEELTKMLLESDLLREEAEHYVLTGPLLTVAIPDTLQDSLMARLDQMKTAKEVAQLGSVLGREFAYEMLQAISTQNEETVQSGLGQLVGAELLYQRGRPPQATYLFKHALIQDAAYASLLKSRRQQVHQLIAELLEARFAEVVETQPELVAHHCTEAGQAETAITYWQLAGQRALEGSAHVEAIAHLSQGLTLLATLPEMPVRFQQELDLQVALGLALRQTKGHTAPEVACAYGRARELCEQLGNTLQLFPVLRGLMVYAQNRGDLQSAYGLGEELLHLSESHPAPEYRMLAHYQMGQVMIHGGKPALACTHYTQVLSLYNPQEHHDLVVRYGSDLGVGAHCFLSFVLWQLGYPDQAIHHINEARTLAETLSHPYSQTLAEVFAAFLSQFCRDVPETQERSETTRALTAEQGVAFYAAYGELLHGWSLVMQGQNEAGIAEIREGCNASLAMGSKVFHGYFLGLLAEAYGHSGCPDEGLPLLAEGIAIGETTELRFYESELYRLQGELLLQQAIPDTSQAASDFHQALDVARAQQAKSWELRTSTSLARLWRSQDKCEDAYDLLAPIYSWFTEGFDTADLIDAKALLDELSEGR